MKAFYFLFLITIMSPLGISAQSIDVKSSFLEKWENSKNYLLAIAELMSEEDYEFKPTERQRSFKEQLVHIKGNIMWLSTSYFTDKEFKRDSSSLPESKEETIKLLNDAFEDSLKIISGTPVEDLEVIVDFFAGPKSKLQILNLLQDHVTHHRGQLIVYLNLKNIIPPKYVGW